MVVLQEVSGEEIFSALDRVAAAITARHAHTEVPIQVVAITNGGIVAAQIMAETLRKTCGQDIPLGCVNATFHRDDIGLKPIPKSFTPTNVPFEIDDALVVLVDDVIFSGRTARAAMNEVFDHGRPARVELAVLCDRGSRALPIQPDYTGLTIAAPSSTRVAVTIVPNDPGATKITVKERKPVQV